MNVRYINPFVTSTKNVFATMLNTHVLIGKARVREPDEARADVAAFIGFSGDACGSVRLCFSKITAVRVASKFADMDVDPASPELADALGELANMVAGHIMLAVLLGFVGMAFGGLGAVGGMLITIPVLLGSVAINFLELFVAFLHAFIFTFLSAVFIGQAVNIHHEEPHEDEYEPASAAGHGH